MNERTFVELRQRGVSGGTTVVAKKHEGLFCTHCARPRSPDAPSEIIVDDEHLLHSPLTGDPFRGITIAKKSLLKLIELKDMSNYLRMGAVRNMAGKLFDDWVYMYSPDRVIIRGTREASFRTCPECGHTLYSAQGPEYLYPAPPEDVPVFQSRRSSLLVDSRFLDRSRLPKSRSLGTQILKIADKPRDGLGEFPYPYG
jgi:hypothetical protein